MFCSTIIPTIGRPTLNRAVHSVLEQDFNADDFEVIVVNDSGQPLPEADWHKSRRVQIIDTNRRERCVARNVGAAVAQGKYLHFLDDDDWLLPGALEIFHQLTNESDAAWIYGGAQLVDREEKPLIKLKHNLNGNCLVQLIAGEWVPLQASLLESSAFFASGAFNPILLASEDTDLGRRIALHNHLEGTPALVACISMGAEGSSSHHALIAQQSRSTREDVLNQPGVFNRLYASATATTWHGRIVRAYLTSMVWNLQHRNITTALSRGVFALAGFVLADRHIFSSDFWHAISTRYHSAAFAAGFCEANLSTHKSSGTDL